MTVDEAIAHAREVAEIQRNNDKLNKTLGKSSPYYNTDCIKCAKEHEHLAEWLEELKALREEKSEFQIIARDNYEMGMENGYNKAIDDMVGNLIANSRTEIIDGKLTLIVTEERIKTVSNKMKNG